MIHEEGVEQRVSRAISAMAERARARRRRARPRAAVPALTRRSATLTAIALPRGVAPKPFRDAIKARRHSHRRGPRAVSSRRAFASATWATFASPTSSARSTRCATRSRDAQARARDEARDDRSSSGSRPAIAVGALSRVDALERAAALRVIALEPVGTVFIRLITMVVVPLVIASVFVGVASLGDVRALGRVGGKTLLYFLGTTRRRGDRSARSWRASRTSARACRRRSRRARSAASDRRGHSTTAAPPTLVQTLVAMIPQNPFAAARGGRSAAADRRRVHLRAPRRRSTPSDARDSVVRFFDGRERALARSSSAG